MQLFFGERAHFGLMYSNKIFLYIQGVFLSMLNSKGYFNDEVKERTVYREKEAYFMLRVLTLLFVIALFL